MGVSDNRGPYDPYYKEPKIRYPSFRKLPDSCFLMERTQQNWRSRHKRASASGSQAGVALC